MQQQILFQKQKFTALRIFITQFKSFLVALLILAVIVSYYLGEIVDGNKKAEYLKEIAKKEGHRPANTWLRGVEKSLKIGRSGLFADTCDFTVRNYADIKSQSIHRDVQDFSQRQMLVAAVEYAINKTELAGVVFPLNEDIRKGFLSGNGKGLNEEWQDSILAAVARVFDAKWWRRAIRVKQGQQYEAVARELGLVSKGKGIYCSEFTLRRRQEQKSRNEAVLLSMEAENEVGYCASLSEMAEASVSNPVNRRNELMTRIRGFEEIAVQREDAGAFFTLTCPSKYHAVLSKSGLINPNFNGATPSDAQTYLCGVWSRIRAAWHRADIRVYGFRVVEPHHDGTPHWHCLFFIPLEQVKEAREIFEKYALEEDGDEKGAEEYRTDFVLMDASKGTAAGYIAKYISKNIDGHGVDIDFENMSDARKTAQRVEAWAATWGIRQFQQIGGPGITQWRELRRLNQAQLLEQMTVSNADQWQQISQAWQAADGGENPDTNPDWAAYVTAMGGPLVHRNDQLLRPNYKAREEKNDYGEIVNTLHGLLSGGQIEINTRLHDWTVRRTSIEKQDFTEEWPLAANKVDTALQIDESNAALGLHHLASQSDVTWTCVNNCTRDYSPPVIAHNSIQQKMLN